MRAEIIILAVVLTVGSGVELYYTTTEVPSPPLPYSFKYTAGRAPGHTDRVHEETSDGSGVVRGQFSYVDPRYKVRTVSYVADANGFHPELSDPVQDTSVVARAKQRHLDLFNKIAAEHAAINAQRALEHGPEYDDIPQ